MIGEQFLVPATILSPKKQLAFALLLFERMLPSLAAFYRDIGFDDSPYLRAKDAAWSALQNGAIDQTLIQALNQACIRNAPDTEEFTHELTSFALNAALAVSDIMEFIVDGCWEHIAHVVTLAHDSLHLYISSLRPSIKSLAEENSEIESHPLMRQERLRQEEDVKFLLSLPEQLNTGTVSALRARATNQLPLLPVSSAFQ